MSRPRRWKYARGFAVAVACAVTAPLQAQIPGWEVIDQHHLKRTVKTSDFATALALVNRIGVVAEEQGHHPDLLLAWGRVGVEIWTHKIDGLTESDFILAAKIEQLVAAA